MSSHTKCGPLFSGLATRETSPSFFTETLDSVESVAVMLQNSPGDLSQVWEDLETNKKRLGHMYGHICQIQAKRSYFSQ